MKFKAKIVSIIKWEKRKEFDFYTSCNFPDNGEYDMILYSMSSVFPMKERILKYLYSLVCKHYGQKIPIELYEFYNNYVYFHVKRPHDYKKGDIVEVDFNISVSKGMINNEQ